MIKQRKGFTIIELLITMAIIGTLLAISVLALNGSRAKSRDAKRVADVQVIRAALEQHWLTRAAYPTVGSFTSMGNGGSYDLLTSNGFEASPASGIVYLQIPKGPNNTEYYQYQSTVSSGFAIRFTTETVTNYGPAGTYYAHSNVVDTDSSSK
jgi:prepilin-type N-terminal cleavage/methylation domain-containing protein